MVKFRNSLERKIQHKHQQWDKMFSKITSYKAYDNTESNKTLGLYRMEVV